VITSGLWIGLADSPSYVTVSRGDGVDDLLWRALDRNIAPLQATFVDDEHLVLPLERLLASRNWLAQALTQHGCAVSFDDPLLAVLRRQDAEIHEVDALLQTPLQIDADAELESLASSRFVRSLKDFQRRDLAHLLALSHGANFSVPGAGKTTVAYAKYESLRARGVVERMLVVAPLSAFEAWTEEASACMDPPPRVSRLETRPLPGTEILLVNYQRLTGRYEVLAEWVRAQPTQVILDEAHRMKRGRNGEWGAACLDLAYLAARRDVLTGTPAPQHPSDFVALLEFLWPGQAARILPRSAMAANPAPEVMSDVSARIGPLFVRTRKDELGLRPPRLRVELSDMKPLQQEIYEALRTRMRRVAATGGDAVTLARMGAVTMYLLQAASNPGLLAPALGASAPAAPTWPPLAIPPDSDLAERIRRYATHETPAKFDKLATMVAANSAQGRKTLVWSNFVENLEGLATGILAPHRPAVIHGGVASFEGRTPGRTRGAELNRFRHDSSCTVLLANPAAMSEGVSLHDVCHDAIYVDRTFNAGQYLQSLDRIHRLGLPPNVETNITFLAHRLTIDETVDNRIRIKADRLARMLEDPNLVTMALPDEDDYGELIDVDDLDALFAHLRADE
jgi:superfamily II DNA or RNA helicase